MLKTEIQLFMESHPDWEAILAAPPYCVKATRAETFGRRLVMFKYTQYDSDFSLRIVRECRGIVFDEDTLAPVSVPFFKFGNYGESYCPVIDWKTARVGEKLDGSLAKFVKFEDGNLLVSTNGSIDAFSTDLPQKINCPFTTFGELIIEALKLEIRRRGGQADDPLGWIAGKLEPGVTYMFELTSPYNKIVVPQAETRLSFLGCRDNLTLEETHFADHPLAGLFNTPKVFPLGSLDDCIRAAGELTLDHEGYVVCDASFNRVKIKSPLYIAAHYMRGDDGTLSYRRAADIIRENQDAEFLTYFPEYTEDFRKMRAALDSLAGRIDRAFAELSALRLASRKEQAAWIAANAKKLSGCLFKMLDEKVSSGSEWVYSLNRDKMAAVLEGSV